MGQDESFLRNCLYFTANSLARGMTRLAEAEFARTGISPSHAFLMMFVNERPGSIQKDLSVELNLAPSTVTRFVDTLVRKGLLRRTLEGRNALIYPTEEGARLQAELLGAWERLFQRYTQILGEEGSQSLTQAADQAARALGE